MGSSGTKLYLNFFAGECERCFGNCVSALFYFSQALKVKARENVCLSKIEVQVELKIYHLTATMLLEKKWPKEAKAFAYKYLRKAWYYDRKEDELVAYDLLGIVYFYENNLPLAQYFHQKMCDGVAEQSEVTKIYMAESKHLSSDQFQAGILEYISH